MRWRKWDGRARDAERLRWRYEPEVILVIGCEFMLFTPGIVPGANFFERAKYLTKGGYDMAELQRKLREYVAKAVAVARDNFHGRITYGAALDLERIDWSLFDIVGLDYYVYHKDRAEHTKELAPFRRGKTNPDSGVRVLHVRGCARARRDGLGDHGLRAGSAAVKDGYFRDEQEQADHLTNMLQVFGAEGLLGASPYTFISPVAPHREERKYDEDIAAFSLMKVIQERSWDPASAYRWEPKKSFHAVSRFYRTH